MMIFMSRFAATSSPHLIKSCETFKWIAIKPQNSHKSSFPIPARFYRHLLRVALSAIASLPRDKSPFEGSPLVPSKWNIVCHIVRFSFQFARIVCNMFVAISPEPILSNCSVFCRKSTALSPPCGIFLMLIASTEL